MAYNLLNVAGIDFQRFDLVLPNAAGDIIPAASLPAATAMELKTITLAGDTALPYDVTISIKEAGGTSMPLVNALTVQPKSTVVLNFNDVCLMAGESLTGFAGTAAKITATASVKKYT
jgi:hypothetical protein